MSRSIFCTTLSASQRGRRAWRNVPLVRYSTSLSYSIFRMVLMVLTMSASSLCWSIGIVLQETRYVPVTFIPLWLLFSSKYPRFNQFFRTLFSPVNIYIFFNNIIVDAIIILLIIFNRKIFHFFNLCIANLNFL